VSWFSDRLGTTGKVKLPTLKNITSTIGDITRPDKWLGNITAEIARTPGNLKEIAAGISGAGQKVAQVGNEIARVGSAVEGAGTGFQVGAATSGLGGFNQTTLLVGGGLLALLLVVLLVRK
jgi:hypothetical protein